MALSRPRSISSQAVRGRGTPASRILSPAGSPAAGSASLSSGSRRRARRSRACARPSAGARVAARRLRARAISKGRSDASRPASPSRSRIDSPAVPCRKTPSRAAANGSRCCASSAPIVPLRTSPVPPLARAGFSNVGPGEPAVRRGDHRPGALEDDDLAPAPGGIGGRGGRAASSSASRSPSAPAAIPLAARRRANSPVWGVRTHARWTPSHQSSSAASERSASASTTAGGGALVGDRQQAPDQLDRGQARSQARSDDECVVLVVEDPGQGVLGLDLLHVVLRQAPSWSPRRPWPRTGAGATRARPGRPGRRRPGPAARHTRSAEPA